jgi:hypothetical protein
MTEKKRILLVALFAAAMAWVESAVVLYLRVMINRVQPYQSNPLPHSVGLGGAEVVREIATLIMLFTVGWLAGRSPRSRFAYALMAFGVWDIFYYIFLIPLTGWPNSLLDWDILFLIPLPWWGPVWAPVSIAALMILGGVLVALYDRPEAPLWPGRRAWVLNLIGTGLALIVFMSDALRALASGMAVRSALPTWFNWPLFLLAIGLMAVPVGEAVWRAVMLRRMAQMTPERANMM